MEEFFSDYKERVIRFTKDREILTVLLISSIIMAVSLLICTYGGRGAVDDVVNFYNYSELIKSGLIPYKDFNFEYPPFALVFFLIPSIFTSDLETYVILFGAEMILFVLLTLYFMMKLAEKININRYFVAIIYMFFIMIYFDQMIKKFDMAAAALTFMSFYFFCERRYNLSYGLMTLAAITKLYPVVLIPILFMMNMLGKEKNKVPIMLKGSVVCVVICALVMVPFLMMSVSLSEIFSFLTFHSDRGFQVESIMGVIVQCLGYFGLTSVEIVPSCYTYDVLSPICDILLPYWLPLCGVAMVFVFLLIYVSIRRTKIDSYDRNVKVLAIYFVSALLLFMLINKVFSTQYVLWLYPFIPFSILIIGKSLNMPMLLLSSLVAVFSVLIILIGVFGQLFLFVNVVRDILLIVIMIELIMFILGRKNIFDVLLKGQS
jgi:hypothetical protein